MLGALMALVALATCQREPSVTDIGTVTGQDAYDMVGQPVRIAGAKVQQVVSDQAFWMGPSASQRVLVVVPGEGSPVAAGDTVNVSGTVERVPSAAEGFRRLNLGTQAEDVLRIQIVYVQATQQDVRRSASQAE